MYAVGGGLRHDTNTSKVLCQYNTRLILLLQCTRAILYCSTSTVVALALAQQQHQQQHQHQYSYQYCSSTSTSTAVLTSTSCDQHQPAASTSSRTCWLTNYSILLSLPTKYLTRNNGGLNLRLLKLCQLGKNQLSESRRQTAQEEWTSHSAIATFSNELRTRASQATTITTTTTTTNYTTGKRPTIAAPRNGVQALWNTVITRTHRKNFERNMQTTNCRTIVRAANIRILSSRSSLSNQSM